MISTIVGSYPKVGEGSYGTKLIGALNQWQRGELTDPQLEETYQQVTRSVINEQEQAGLDVLSDGQIRWEDIVTPIARRLQGFEINGLTRWFNNNVYYRRPILHKAPKRTRPMLVEEYRFAASCTKKDVKAVLPGPYSFAWLCEDRHYKRRRPFVLKMAEILNEEARALAEAGASMIQFDEPAIGFEKTNAALIIEAINTATRGVKAKTAVSMYFGEIDRVLQPLMKTRVDVIGVDVVSDTGAIKSLRQSRITKELALGCVDGRNTKLETVKDLHELFDAVGRCVSLDRVYVNPNCGLEFLPHTQALWKIRRMVEAVESYKNKRKR